ncbi:hypothetical protein [uncultured Bacteroides sp.]|uniref:hypothetical protein n=1 Tax=uncultured Bacteroides sp. TaxID=162156 RepID=UPI00261966B0|nr:hypothetical protein [uncultured Bacteroides sp.]
MTSIGPQAPPMNMATYIDFYDDYIVWNGFQKFVYQQTNWDGSLQFVSMTAGPSALSTVCVMVSSDYSMVREIQQSTMMGMTMQLVYDYSYIGEGAQPAINVSGSNVLNGSDRSGSNSSSSGSRVCSRCGGTKYDPTPYNYSASADSYHNYLGNSCGFCGKSTDHYHYRCHYCSADGMER